MLDKLMEMLNMFGDKSQDADNIKQQNATIQQVPFRGTSYGVQSPGGKGGLYDYLGVKNQPLGESGDYQDFYDFTSAHRPGALGQNPGQQNANWELLNILSVLAEAGLIDTSGTGGWGDKAKRTRLHKDYPVK